ncbi:MAG TPA: CheR family methyltransferase [Abditibacteriaceae bacterium]|jgi:two-component system CheB/CheR fusion protein
MTESTSPEFEALLAYLKRTRGFDFTAYKRTSLVRRVEKRMQQVGVDNFTAYVDYLEVHADEFTALFNTILINVTSFFRDPAAWEHIASDVLPFIRDSRDGNAPIRIWSAGCASGEEAYTLMMVAAECLGIDVARERVKVYATDADEEALAQARSAVYTTRQMEALPEGLAEKYFVSNGDRWTFHGELRRNIIFGRHDLVQDAPISRIDFLVCRNAMMYFNSETQGRVLARFHFALNDGGFLFLGKSETLLTHATLFSPVDMRRRIFAKVPRSSLRDRLHLMTQSQTAGEPIVQHLVTHARVREAAADAMPTAQIILEPNGQVLQINAEARSMFGLSSKDIGRPLHDLEVSYRPVELRSLVERARTEMKKQNVREIDWPVVSTGEFRCIDVEVVPLRDSSGLTLGTSISFSDVSLYRKLQAELQHANQELETTLEELQSTNEELETTNEELQSTVEELETTNEELQSTNEELETMNEELQSTNEELQTINDELRLRSEELHEVNTFLESILSGLRGGVAVLTREMEVQVWNIHAENLWGLRLDEVQGKHLMNLDFGLPVDELKTPIRACLSGESNASETTLQAINRRGKAIACHVSITPLRADVMPDAEIRGVIVVMNEV